MARAFFSVGSVVSQSPSGDFLLGRRPAEHFSIKDVLTSQSPSGDFLLGRGLLLSIEHNNKKRLNPPRGIFCWEAHDLLPLFYPDPTSQAGLQYPQGPKKSSLAGCSLIFFANRQDF